jgi:hypothetical protein
MLASIDEWTKVLTGQQTLDLHTVFAKYASTKGPEWMYEKEWNIITFARQGEKGHFSDYRFDPRKLRSVYLAAIFRRKTRQI